MKKPTEHSTDVVDNYVKFRSNYPPEIVQILRKMWTDIGSGTGFLSKLFLDYGIRCMELRLIGMHQAIEKYQKNGRVEFLYSTKLYYGHFYPMKPV